MKKLQEEKEKNQNEFQQRIKKHKDRIGQVEKFLDEKSILQEEWSGLEKEYDQIMNEIRYIKETKRSDIQKENEKLKQEMLNMIQKKKAKFFTQKKRWSRRVIQTDWRAESTIHYRAGVPNITNWESCFQKWIADFEHWEF